MGFVDAIKSVFGKYATFSGRASRSEYWYFYLFYFIAYLVLAALDMALGSVVLFTGIYLLGIIVPIVSLSVRRLHDVNRSGWWYWIFLVPLVGAILLLFWACTKGTTGDNRFGADPLAQPMVG